MSFRILQSLTAFTIACLPFLAIANGITTNPYFTEIAPDATLIEINAVDEFGDATIVGQPGAVMNNAIVSLVNLQTGGYRQFQANADGSFSGEIFAPPGSNITVHHNDESRGYGSYFIPTAAATLVRSPLNNESAGAFATTIGKRDTSIARPDFVDIESIGQKSVPKIWIAGEIPETNWSAGQSGTLTGEASLYDHNLSHYTLANFEVNGRLFLQRIIDDQGNQERPHPEAMSHVLTPSGLPIERRRSIDSVMIGEFTVTFSTMANARRADSTWQINYEVPANLPNGVYKLVFETSTYLPQFDDLYYEDIDGLLFINDRLFTSANGEAGWVSQIQVGELSERKLAPVIGMNALSQGSRGIVSIEERGRFGIAGHMIINSKEFILPMVDTRTGEKFTYSLEPFLPMISAGNKGTPSPPTINFDFTSGEYSIIITRPDGSVLDLGSGATKGAFYQAISNLHGGPLSPNSNNPTQFFGLTTLQGNFRVRFDQYGLHDIKLTGSIEDVFGNEYSLNGTYEVWVAKALDFEEGVFPSTPFEVGDSFAPTLIVQPGVPAAVEMTLRHYPNSDVEELQTHSAIGMANSYGYFAPSKTPFVFTQPGEYRVDYTASFVDEDGVLWMGSSTWGSVVETPDSQLIAHGSRGFDGGGPDAQWLFMSDDDEVGVHLEFPYQSGDVMWMEEAFNEPRNIADVPAATLQDLSGELTTLFEARADEHMPRSQQGATTDRVRWDAAKGELPLFSSSASELSPAWVSADTNYWAYAYTGAARPGVRVREMISESAFENGYWRFDDSYNYQLGNGINGDLANDFKFQFVGSVVRAPSENFYQYGAYGSLFVLLPNSEPVGGRVTPPFQGASGGPDGGPLFTFKGEDIDIFLHLTGVRPGSLLEVGDTAVFSGQVAPTLPGSVEMTITSPSGQQRTISGTGNKIGYFYIPNSSFLIDESGVWDVQVSVTYDGETSSGPVEAPYPSGDVLGSDAGSFSFYAVDKFADRIVVNQASELARAPATETITVNLQAPAGFNATAMHQTTTMPGFLLEQSHSNEMSYTYDAATLHEDYPNLDLVDRDGRSGADTVTMSFLMSGTDSNGNPAHVARQLLLQGEVLYNIEPSYTAILENAITLNQESFTGGDTLDIDLNVIKTNTEGADLYVVIQFPDGNFVTLSQEPFAISAPNQIFAYRNGETRAGSLNYPIIETTLPSDMSTGTYKIFAIFTTQGANVEDPTTWLSIAEKQLSIN